MPNIASAKKRLKQSEVRRKRNVARKSDIKTAVKKVVTAIDAKEPIEKIQELLKAAESKIARAKRKVFHPNTSSRKVSKLAKKVSEYKKSSQ